MTASRVDFVDISAMTVTANAISPAETPAMTCGGYPDEIFLNITEKEKEWLCGICLLLPREASACVNGHVFCSSCITTWSRCSGNNRNCPVCKVPGSYRIHVRLTTELGKKRVRCVYTKCKWTGILREYQAHEMTHGRTLCNVNHSIHPVLFPNIGWTRANSSVRLNLPETSTAMTPGPLNGTLLPVTSRDVIEIQNSTIQMTPRRRNQSITRETSMFRSLNGHHVQNDDTICHWWENQRRGQLAEIEAIGRRLGEVSGDLNYFVSGMSMDRDRYRSYLEDSLHLGRHVDALQRQGSTVMQNNRVHTRQSTRKGH